MGLRTPWGPRLLTPLSYSGQSGLGKSTLVNTLFKSQVSRKASSWNREEKIPKTVEIKAIGHGEGVRARRGDGAYWGVRHRKDNLDTE